MIETSRFCAAAAEPTSRCFITQILSAHSHTDAHICLAREVAHADTHVELRRPVPITSKIGYLFLTRSAVSS